MDSPPNWQDGLKIPLPTPCNGFEWVRRGFESVTTTLLSTPCNGFTPKGG